MEILLERPLSGQEALAQLSASKPIRAGLEVRTAGGVVRVVRREGELWCIALPQPALEFFEHVGEVPLPPYIRRPAAAADRERYQSIFAREPGAVAHDGKPALRRGAGGGPGGARRAAHARDAARRGGHLPAAAG